MYIRTQIDAHVFAGPPDAGPAAVADLFLVRAIDSGGSDLLLGQTRAPPGAS